MRTRLVAFFLLFIAVALIIVFFVTTLDSGSIVIDGMTAGGKLEVPVKQKVVLAVYLRCYLQW